MPFGKRRLKNGKVQVINKDTKRVLGTHPNKEAANKQLAALAINDPGDFGERKSRRRR